MSRVQARACKAGASDYYLASICGRSSGVERNLAKVDVVSSNLIARSNFLNKFKLDYGGIFSICWFGFVANSNDRFFNSILDALQGTT